MLVVNYIKKLDVVIYYYWDMLFYLGFVMNYMQKGFYVVVVNFFLYSLVIVSDCDLVYGVFDIKINFFFLVSNNVEFVEFYVLICEGDIFFNQNGWVYMIVCFVICFIVVIMFILWVSYYYNFCDQVSLMLLLGIICSILLVLVWLCIC